MIRKLVLLALTFFSFNLSFAQTVTQGEGNAETNLISISAGVQQSYTSMADKPVNSFFIGIGRMPTIEKPFYYDVLLHHIPSYSFKYHYSIGRRFSGESASSQAAYLGFGILAANKYSKVRFHPMFGLGLKFIFKPGYDSISPSYTTNDFMIDNNGLSVGIQPHIGFIYRMSDKIYLEGKVGYSVQKNKNQHMYKADLYENHLWSQLNLRYRIKKK